VSSGFGRIMTEQLLARGDRIAGTVRNLSVMDDLKAKQGDRLWQAELDLSEIASIGGVVDRAWKETKNMATSKSSLSRTRPNLL
jgi:NADP-dependent 3-hydroxy acid dehydrogenase YdfG